MNRRLRKKLYRSAILKWGLKLQMGMLMEECAELIQASNKVLRSNLDTGWPQLAEEIADVEIMIEQIKTHVDWCHLEESVEVLKEEKLKRLAEILDFHG